jgi:ribosomal protein L13E
MSSSTKKKAKKPSGKAASAGKKAKRPAVKQKTKTKEKKEIEEVREKGIEKEEEEPAKKVSAKPKAKSPEKKESPPRTVAKKAVPKILGPAPSATIISRYNDSTQERAARGFSFGELESASISLIEARNQKLSVDIRRRTILDDNIESLKAWLKDEPPSSEK